jgi:hypothetical protein
MDGQRFDTLLKTLSVGGRGGGWCKGWLPGRSASALSGESRRAALPTHLQPKRRIVRAFIPAPRWEPSANAISS